MESVFRLTDPGTRFFYTGTHWFRKGTHDISPDESQDSPYLFVTKSLIVVTFSHVYVVILLGETDFGYAWDLKGLNVPDLHPEHPDTKISLSVLATFIW